MAEGIQARTAETQTGSACVSGWPVCQGAIPDNNKQATEFPQQTRSRTSPAAIAGARCLPALANRFELKKQLAGLFRHRSTRPPTGAAASYHAQYRIVAVRRWQTAPTVIFCSIASTREPVFPGWPKGDARALEIDGLAYARSAPAVGNPGKAQRKKVTRSRFDRK